MKATTKYAQQAAANLIAIFTKRGDREAVAYFQNRLRQIRKSQLK